MNRPEHGGRYRRLLPLVLVAAAWLAACGQPQEPATAPATTATADAASLLDALQLPKSAYPPVLGIERRKWVVDAPDALPAGPVDRPVQAFRDAGLVAASAYKYTLKAGAKPRRYSVRLNLYRDRASAVEGWARRYPPEEQARGEALALGDEGFALGGAIRAFRIGRAMVEIEGGGEPMLIEAFATAYAAHAESLRPSLTDPLVTDD